MISIGIFAMILTAIYSIWIGILRGSQAGLKVAAEVQRTRIALRTLEEAFTGAEYFMGNPKYYTFLSDTSGEFAEVEMSSRIPDTFLGAEQTKLMNQKVRRLHFFTRPGRNGNELMMTETPLLAVTANGYEPYSVTLARDVTFFQLAFYDDLKNEWLDAWKYTNKLPRLVQIGLGLGKTAGDARKPYELVYSLVALPAENSAGLEGQAPHPTL